jgi:hypothetical protein
MLHDPRRVPYKRINKTDTGIASMNIFIKLASQQLLLRDQQNHVMREFRISSALNGPGQLKNSGCTPLGLHYVRAKIGDGCDADTVFVGRRPTGERYSASLAAAFPQRDWILSRILWLSGLEVGFNRLGNCDTMQRFIYIHGTPETEPLGEPRSHGCIRMHPRAMIELFDLTPLGTRVQIGE